MSKQFTLGKDERLKSRKQIEKLFAEGRNFALNPFRVYYVVNSVPMSIGRSVHSLLHFGVGVSARNFKRAVDRNRIKRLAREAWRLQKNELKEVLKGHNRQLNVFFIYTSKEIPEYKFVFDKVKSAIDKLIKTVEQK